MKCKNCGNEVEQNGQYVHCPDCGWFIVNEDGTWNKSGGPIVEPEPETPPVESEPEQEPVQDMQPETKPKRNILPAVILLAVGLLIFFGERLLCRKKNKQNQFNPEPSNQYPRPYHG